MPNYWLPIMAVAFAGAVALWITLVFMADRKQSHPTEVPPPPREIAGGMFEARQGGRQVMPDPFGPIVHDDDETSQELPEPAPPAKPVKGVAVPEQRKAPAPEQAPARENRL